VRRPENSLRGAEVCSEHYSISERDSVEVAMQDVARRALSHYLSAFRPRGVPGPTSKLSLRVPTQMGRREMEHKGEKREPWLVLSCAQGGCACSRGLQVFVREGESLLVSPSSRAATFSYEGPGPSFYRCKERV
jgi:hypothetical protein